jgi:hypothetical protein
MDEARMDDDAGGERTRVDWRTGKVMTHHDEAFWREHEQRRVQQGLTVPQYCAANGLALSTFRYRVSGKSRTGATAPRPKSAPAQPMSFLPVAAPPAAAPALVEVALEGMTLRLGGEAAERVLASVMARLA